ncbi:hypothetical protein E4U54_001860 [Claviceps lovelessii]|nr:hypothetical protein E4U54_001860 [Claviceps lovelessii]
MAGSLWETGALLTGREVGRRGQTWQGRRELAVLAKYRVDSGERKHFEKLNGFGITCDPLAVWKLGHRIA